MEAVKISLKLLMRGKEVGCIIGKKGETIKKLREESGAHINISIGSLERIVVIAGRSDSVFHALKIILNMIEKNINRAMESSAAKGTPPVMLRIIVPSTQCGSIIGKGGSKIKEIMKSSGAHVHLDIDLLPNSTEKAITIAGTPLAIHACVQQICVVMLECPPKGVQISYRSRPTGSRTVLAAGPQTGDPSDVDASARQEHRDELNVPNDLKRFLQNQSNPTDVDANAQVAGPPLELNIPNYLIGCIIGKRGAKIKEIRQASGADIIIEELKGSAEPRRVTISGSPASISMANQLINTEMNIRGAK